MSSEQSDGGLQIKGKPVTVDDGLFTVYANGKKLSSFFDTRFQQGKIALQLAPKTKIDNFLVNEVQK